MASTGQRLPTIWMEGHQFELFPRSNLMVLCFFRSAASVKNHYTSTLSRKIRLGLIKDLVEKSRVIPFKEACSMLKGHSKDTESDCDIHECTQVIHFLERLSALCPQILTTSFSIVLFYEQEPMHFASLTPML